MARNQLCDRVLTELAWRCAKHDYKRSRKPSGVKLVRGGRCFAFNLIFLDYRPSWDVRCWWGIRVESIEAVYHRTSGYDAKFHKGTTTIGMEYEGRFEFEDEEDVEAAVDGLYEIFLQQALPFYRHASSLAAIDKLLNESPADDSTYGAPPQRYHYGMIVAKAVGRKRLNHLAKTYRRKLSAFSDGFYLPQFDALLSDLQTIDLSGIR